MVPPFVEISSLPWRDTSICETKIRCVSEKQQGMQIWSEKNP
jgi:hypothetical protein